MYLLAICVLPFENFLFISIALFYWIHPIGGFIFGGLYMLFILVVWREASKKFTMFRLSPHSDGGICCCAKLYNFLWSHLFFLGDIPCTTSVSGIFSQTYVFKCFIYFVFLEIGLLVILRSLIQFNYNLVHVEKYRCKFKQEI